MYIIVGKDEEKSRESAAAAALANAGHDVLYIVTDGTDRILETKWKEAGVTGITVRYILSGEDSLAQIEDLDWEDAEFFYINQAAFDFSYAKETEQYFAMCRQFGTFSCLDMAGCGLPPYTSEVITDLAREADIVHIPETDEPEKSMAIYLYGGCRVVVHSNAAEILLAARDKTVQVVGHKPVVCQACLMAGLLSGISSGMDFSQAAHRALGAGILGLGTCEEWDHAGME